MRRSPTFRWIQCTSRKKLFLLEKGSGMTFLPTSKSFKGDSLQAHISKFVVIKMNEKLTALFIGIL